MDLFKASKGLVPVFVSPPESSVPDDIATEEAAVCTPAGGTLPVSTLVAEGDRVARGDAIVQLRHDPDIRLTAPISGTVARIAMQPGRRLVEVVLFREGDDVVEHDTAPAQDSEGIRRLLQHAGFWPLLRRRPFGGMPAADERPVAILVMATDTRPGAPDPCAALSGREEDFAHGLTALGKITDGPVIVCASAGDLPEGLAKTAQIAARGARHPQGAAGVCCHTLCPAGINAPVWDLHAEDVAALGALLETGVLPVMRDVRIGGSGLREGQRLRTHPGADLRQLTRKIVLPGPHVLLSGSPLDGQKAHWLGLRDRQITVLPSEATARKRHWLIDALSHAPRGLPAIPTAALDQAFAGALPAAPLIRALGAGDDETAAKLGLLSLLEEDVALADYVLGAGGEVVAQLRTMLDGIQSELGA